MSVFPFVTGFHPHVGAVADDGSSVSLEMEVLLVDTSGSRYQTTVLLEIVAGDTALTIQAKMAAAVRDAGLPFDLSFPGASLFILSPPAITTIPITTSL